MLAAMGDGTREQPWVLKTPSGGSEYQAYRDESLDPPALVVQVGKTELRYHLRCLDDLHAMLNASTATGCRSATPTSRSRRPRARSRPGPAADDNPVGGWYGLKKGLRGRFANYVPPVHGGARPGRGRAQRPQQPHARALAGRV